MHLAWLHVVEVVPTMGAADDLLRAVDAYVVGPQPVPTDGANPISR